MGLIISKICCCKCCDNCCFGICGNIKKKMNGYDKIEVIYRTVVIGDIECPVACT